jgi:hypothetical protein
VGEGDLDAVFEAALSRLPAGWNFEGLRRDRTEATDSWQAMAWRDLDDAWATGSGGSPAQALAALIASAIEAADLSAIDAESVEPPSHRTVEVLIDGEPTRIDEDLGPLIAALNAGGLRTISCCQQSLDGYTHVDFDSVDDAAVFLSMVAAEFSTDYESLWNRVTRDGEPENDWERFRRTRMWRYSASATDFSVRHQGVGEGRTLVRDRPAAFDFSIGVAFPPSDIPEVTRLVVAAAASSTADPPRGPASEQD